LSFGDSFDRRDLGRLVVEAQQHLLRGGGCSGSTTLSTAS